jgi:hypothetical protein
MRIDGFDAGDDIELPPAGEHQVATAKIFQMRAEPAGRATHAFGNYAEFAMLRREDRDNPIRFPIIHPAQYNRLGSIETFLKRCRHP